MVKVRFLPWDVTIDAFEGSTLLETARRAGVGIESPCNGSGQCGKCRVRVSRASLPNIRRAQSPSLSREDEKLGLALACHTVIRGTVEVEILNGESPPHKMLTHGRMAARRHDPWIRKVYEEAGRLTRVYAGDALLDTEPGDTTRSGYGVAVDIGTTTLVVSLVDLTTGEEVGSLASLNPQTLYGHDVLSRIRIASEPDGLCRLQGDLIRELNRMIGTLARRRGADPGRIYESVFSGNTCMLHLAAGVDPRPLGKFPYTPTLTGGSHLSASRIGLAGASKALVHLPPVISGYVGADITSGILATELHKETGVTLFVDVGTNGEMVLAIKGQLTATSTAAGPAFEGMNIACGMRAAEGAIEIVTVEEDGRLTVQTIGNTEPVGICGSGLVDVVGELVANGVVDTNGRLATANGHLLPSLRERLGARDGKPVFEVAGMVFLTQKDVRQVQLAKGAVRAGIEMLLSLNGLAPSDVDRVLVAGSFGYHLRARSLVRIGLLPAALGDRVEFVGNTSKTGAQAFLLDQSARREMADLVRGIKKVDLSSAPHFEKTFVECLAFGE